MTDLAAGHITKQEADKLMNPKKMHQKAPKQEFEEKDKDHTEINAREVKQSHKYT